MQRLADRLKRAQRRVAKQKAAEEKFKLSGEAWERNQNRVRIIKDHTKAFRADRVNRKIDWESGALAPRRDVGDLATTYGAFSVFNFQPPEKDPKTRLKEWHIRVGDRVVVTRGRDRGKIGAVEAIDEDRNGVTVKGVNVIDLAVPQSFKDQQQDARDITSVEQMVDVQDVRLVYPLPDPISGIPRDVVVEKVELKKEAETEGEEDAVTGEKESKVWRVIEGTNTIIPWPKAREEDDPEDFEVDTLRITVEERTFRPFLIRSPMPLSVIDELRDKYSPLRERHDFEYRAKKEAEEAKKEGRKDLIKTMRTPLQELADLREKKKLEAEQARELTPEQLAKIGEVIAQEQTKMTRAIRGGAV